MGNEMCVCEVMAEATSLPINFPAILLLLGHGFCERRSCNVVKRRGV